MNGTELKAMRERHNLSQRAMADILGVSRDRLRYIETNDTELRAQEEARASEWAEGEPGEPIPRKNDLDRSGGEAGDQLPNPPYNPADEPAVEVEGEIEEKPKPRRGRPSGPRKRQLSTWQQETAQSLISLFCGEQVTLDSGQTVSIPGLCHLIAQVEPHDARVIFDGMPAFAVALVKVAPRHPFLKSLLGFATASGDYQELFQASIAIALPIAAHHGMLPTGPQPVIDAASTNGHVEGTTVAADETTPAT